MPFLKSFWINYLLMGNIQNVGLYQNPKKLHTRESLHHHSERCTPRTIYHWAWKGTHKEHQKYFLPVYTYLWRETDQKQSVGIWCWPQCVLLGSSLWTLLSCTRADVEKAGQYFITTRFSKVVMPVRYGWGKMFKINSKTALIWPADKFLSIISFRFYLNCCFSSAHDSASPITHIFLSSDDV